MANPVMEAKALKLQRQLRQLPRVLVKDAPGVFHKHTNAAIPKRLGAEGVVAPRQPNAELMKGYKHRAASLAREAKGPINLTEEAARMEVLAHMRRLREFEADEFQRSFTILNTHAHRARVFFNPPRTVYILLYENFKKHTVQSSLPHVDKIELIDKFRADCLQWVRIRSSG